MFFEGAEKKAEIQVHNDRISLLHDIPNSYWESLVERCAAKILSSIENPSCKAFLLSESSLFVWDDRFLIITCGETRLVKAIEYFIQSYGSDTIRQLTYQRKNEYFSRAQHSSFSDDVILLSRYVEGNAFRFGSLDTHHNYVFHYENDFCCDSNDKTYELLAYQISERASEFLSTPDLSNEQIRAFFKFDQLIPDFAIDDFVFDPFGYSMNAIHDDQYLTIHVTPQQGSSYVSFEANIDLISLSHIILDVLQPRSFDILTFNDSDTEQKIANYVPTEFVTATKAETVLTNGYDVKFINLLLPMAHYAEPTAVSFTGEHYVF